LVCPFGRPSTKPARRVGERVSDFGFDQQGRLNMVKSSGHRTGNYLFAV